MMDPDNIEIILYNSVAERLYISVSKIYFSYSLK